MDGVTRPACQTGAHSPDSKWRESQVSGRLLAFFEPCKRCFPEGTIPADVDTVVRSRGNQGKKLHLPADSVGENAEELLADGGDPLEPRVTVRTDGDTVNTLVEIGEVAALVSWNQRTTHPTQVQAALDDVKKELAHQIVATALVTAEAGDHR